MVASWHRHCLPVRPYARKQSSRYRHEILRKKCLTQECLVSGLCPFENRNSVTVVYIFMKLYSNVYQVTMTGQTLSAQARCSKDRPICYGTSLIRAILASEERP